MQCRRLYLFRLGQFLQLHTLKMLGLRCILLNQLMGYRWVLSKKSAQKSVLK